jgi:hypothetical protein
MSKSPISIALLASGSFHPSQSIAYDELSGLLESVPLLPLKPSVSGEC